MRDECYYNVEAVVEKVEIGLAYGKTKSIHARLGPCSKQSLHLSNSTTPCQEK